MNTAPLLPGIVTGEPVECSASELTATLDRIRLAGFHVLQMHVITKPSQGYRLTLTRCACDLCAELTKPSDQIKATLRHSLDLELKTAALPPSSPVAASEPAGQAPTSEHRTMAVLPAAGGPP